MPDFLFLRNYRKYSLEQVKRDINLSGNLSIDAFEKDEYLYAITYHKNAPLKGKRIFSNESWVILFAGDLPDYDFIPYNHLIELVEGQKFELLKNFNGIFSILL